MHAKLMLIEDGADLISIFGSINWTLPSFYLNHEVAVISKDPALYHALLSRWSEIASRIGASR